jgi:uncharacterized membrane protein
MRAFRYKDYLLVILTTILIIAYLFIPSFYGPVAAEENLVEKYEEAKVLDVGDISKKSNSVGIDIGEQIVKVQFTSGPYQGKSITAINGMSGSQGFDIHVKPNDKVVICYFEKENTPFPESIEQAYISDIVRIGYLKILAGVFVFLLILIGGLQGIKALVALGFTILGIYKILLPAILAGYSPLPITVLVLAGVTLFTMVVVAGFTRKSMAATLGTLGGVVVASLLAYFGGEFASLHGLATEEERMLLYLEQVKLDIRGLLFSGILIGAVGAIMDVAMSIASSVEEVKRANPNLTPWQLVQAGMRVGKDIMGTMTNTLILAYAGGALPILILFLAYNYPAVRIMNSELIATEVVRALAGSIGLIISVPITALIAGLLAGWNNPFSKGNKNQVRSNIGS